MDNIKREFLEFAKLESPKEACALVIVQKGKLRLIKCKNLASDNNHFRLHSDDWIRAEESGEIVALIHSHPDVSSNPSEADKVSCESTGVPWLIVSLLDNSWTELKPTGFVQPLFGRNFYHGVVDCYTLIRDWYKQERNVQLRNFHRDDDWWMNGQNLYVDNFKLAGFNEIQRINGDLDFQNIQEDDVILMQIQSNVPNHAGIYIGNSLIAHHLHGRLSSRDVFGGMYQKHATHILRYQNA